ncbi:hypothetical protein [Candidatus Enterococcus clewellii]|uniref:Lipoprotein n=1 Tax=Candidatus Enterococcus clewellii TaxID=1834193 RepID=A0AAQ3VUB6_9ENTE
MKKIIFAVFVAVFTIGLSACGSNGGKTENTSVSTTKQSIKESTEDSSAKEEKKMEQMEKSLDEKNIKISYLDGYLYLTREKGIDYDYFKMVFKFDTSKNEIFEVGLELMGNIDGKKKDYLYYGVSNDRIVEKSYKNTDINAIAEVLEDMNYSDQELLEFAQWYYDNNK